MISRISAFLVTPRIVIEKTSVLFSMKAIYQRLFLGFILISMLTVTIRATTGTLDTSFGTGGKVKIDFDGNPTPGASDQDSGLDVAIQPDGKIVIVGETFITTTDTVFSATRLNVDGSVDTSFAINGRFLLNTTVGGTERAYGVAIQSDGKILIAGWSNSIGKRVVLRLNANGTLDASFGTGGIFETVLGNPTFDEAEIAIQPDGKIIVSGTTKAGLGSDAFSVMRLNTNGTFDTTFDGDGQAVTVFAANDRAYGVKLQADGKIVVSGSTNFNAAFALARYNSDGSLDTSFDGDGKVTTNFPGGAGSLAYNLAIQPDGKIIAAGYKRTVESDGALARYNPNGSLDTTFGTDGLAVFGNTANETFWDVHLRNGNIICTGFRSLVDPSSQDDFMIVRFSGNGVLDTGFAASGVRYLDFNTSRDICLTSVYQPDGKLILAGYSTAVNPFNPDFAAARFNANDAVVDFDGDGKSDYSIIRRAAPVAPWAWWLQESSTGSIKTLDFGSSPIDFPQPGDFDGDGKDDIAMWRNFPQPGSTNAYYILQSSTNTIRIIAFGLQDDVPVIEDYDGDGKDDPAVWRVDLNNPGQAFWYYLGSFNNPNNNITYVPWGMRYGTLQSQADEPYSGDFDGDGRADFAVQRLADINSTNTSSAAVFHILTASGNISYQYFGWKSDRIVPGDYDGDGKTDICVVRGFNISNTDIIWRIRYSSGRPDDSIVFGRGNNFNFAQGDYDGDGATDISMYVGGNFWWRASSNGNVSIYPFGIAGDLPIAIYNNR